MFSTTGECTKLKTLWNLSSVGVYYSLFKMRNFHKVKFVVRLCVNIHIYLYSNANSVVFKLLFVKQKLLFLSALNNKQENNIRTHVIKKTKLRQHDFSSIFVFPRIFFFSQSIKSWNLEVKNKFQLLWGRAIFCSD